MKDSVFRPHGMMPRSSQNAAAKGWLLHQKDNKVLLRFLADGRDTALQGAPSIDRKAQAGSMIAQIDHSHRVLVLTRRETASAGGRVAWLLVGAWDVPSGRRLAEFPADRCCLGLDATGRWLLTANASAPELIVTDLQSGKEVHRTPWPDLAPSSGEGSVGSPEAILVGTTGDRLAIKSKGGLYFWDATRNQPTAVCHGTGHAGRVISVAQTAAASLVATGGEDGTIVVRDRERGSFLRMLSEHPDGVSALDFSPDGAYLVSASSPTQAARGVQQRPDAALTVIRWDLKTFAPAWVYRGVPATNGVVAVDYTDTHRIIVATADGHLLRLDDATGRLERSATVDPSGILSYHRSPDGKRFVVLTPNRRVRVVDAETFDPVYEWESAAADKTVAFLNNGVVVTGGSEIRLRDVATGRPLLTMDVADGPIRQLTVPAGSDQVVYSGSGDVIHRLHVSDLQNRLRELNLAMPEAPPDR